MNVTETCLKRRLKHPISIRLQSCETIIPTDDIDKSEIQRNTLSPYGHSPFGALQKLKEFQVSDSQRMRLQDWFIQKEKMGELKGEEIEAICDIGSGHGGTVTKAFHRPSGIVMAQKRIHLEVKSATINQIIKELKVLHCCNSPYIVGFYGAFYTQGDISICMEYMDGRSLDVIYKKVGRISEEILSHISASVLKGLCYLKEQLNVMHRDIKPSNILANTRGDVKLCDFGVSAELHNSLATSFVGTRPYMAPERLKGDYYNVKSDIWSFGLVLVELAVGRYPLPAPTMAEYELIFGSNIASETAMITVHMQNSQGAHLPLPPNSPMAIFELLEYIENEPPPSLPRGVFSLEFVHFVDSCLKKDLQERSNLVTLLNHNFIVQSQFTKTDFAKFVNECNPTA